MATAIDAGKKNVTLAGGQALAYDRLVLSPGIDFNYARHRRVLGRSRGNHAARMEGRPADAAADEAARGHGRRRRRRHDRAGQSIPLPAGPLRAGLHDRALPQDAQTEVEARHLRCQADVLQTGSVRGSVREVLRRHHRPEPDERDRQLRRRPRRSKGVGGGDQVRHQAQGCRRQRHPAADRRQHRRQSRVRRRRLVSDQAAELHVGQGRRHLRHRRCRHRRRDAEVGLFRQ